MNSSYGKSSSKTGSINAFDFDLGLGGGRGGKPLNDQKAQTASYSSAPSWTPSQPNKPAWTHKPATPAPAPAPSSGPGSLSGPTSMVGDIFGKSWNSSAPSNTGIGIVNSNNPNLFGDLLGSAMGQSKSTSNVPLKSSAPATAPHRFSMGSMGNSLPKTGSSAQTWGTNVSNVGGSVNSSGKGNNINSSSSSSIGGGNVNLGGNSNRSPNLGGPLMKSMAGGGIGGGGMGSNKDPFGSLVDFTSKPVGGSSKQRDQSGLGNDSFGAFQSNTNGSSSTSSLDNDPFSSFGFSGSQTNNSKASGSSASAFSSGVSPDMIGDFGFQSSQPSNPTQPPMQSSGGNDFDALFSSSGGAGGFTDQKFTEGDDWGINSEFDDSSVGGTTELDGLPPPPSGVSAPIAQSKGVDNYKKGQFADAITWLSWAVILLEKAGDMDGTMEVLICRASCYKEVGEYKKAVADCTKVLEQDGKNVSVLVQRALLYESMEKYKLGAEDLRTVMKIDPGNRVARSTVHRLAKMAE
ncbi:uncharacterized protein LOC127266557 [Andrographis paniculata]|uniref:uncharacterized protein LOC127266557 n=1 Tax=Andrographis paniculata TaxID=175694 RepID=UPI0021E6EED4|nr:uncharacterized protein LOC127266557 [Andrographis paniculata]XP_051152789.1 uncharacterized protein LOC127266557 [Andrographis paniculata]